MLSLPDPQSAAEWCLQQRAQNKTIGYVPTMGALHRGHLSLVERAVSENDITCVSIFVNPLQFNRSDDLQKYPRDMERDIALLESGGCDMLYSGTLAQFFPQEADTEALIEKFQHASNEELSVANRCDALHGLESEFRPRHLHGVWAIVERLFTTVGPCTAYFGEKDFQQTLVVKELAKQFTDINVVVCPTIREASGVAMSSRNSHLSDEQMHTAAKLYQSLLEAKKAWHAGVRAASELETIMRTQLDDANIRVEYVAVRDETAWRESSPDFTANDSTQHARALVAAYVGEIRLIDNIRLE